MERDFMGLGVGMGKYSDAKDAGSKVGSSNSSQDSALFGSGSDVRWQSASNTPSPSQPLVSFCIPHEEELKDRTNNRNNGSGKPPDRLSMLYQPVTFDTSEGYHKPAAPRQYMPQQGYGHCGNRAFPMVFHPPAPLSIGNSSFKVQPSPSSTLPSKEASFKLHNFIGPGVSTTANAVALAPREAVQPLPKATQLTMFYDGVVHVFDNVPEDMVHEILSLANRASSTAANSTLGSQSFGTATTAVTSSSQLNHAEVDRMRANWGPSDKRGNIVPSQSMNLSSSLPSLKMEPLTPTLLTATSLATQQTELAVPPSLAATTAVAVSPRVTAVPQARKVSLARFLERRKDRTVAAAPYPTDKRLPDYSAGVDSRKSSSVELPAANNHSPRPPIYPLESTAVCLGKLYPQA